MYTGEEKGAGTQNKVFNSRESKVLKQSFKS